MSVDGRILVVKVPPEFAGNVVEGRLVALPEASARRFLRDNAAPLLVKPPSLSLGLQSLCNDCRATIPLSSYYLLRVVASHER